MLGKRVLVLLMVVALLLPFGAALAQGGGETFCGDLAAEDCDILLQSATAMAGITSVSFDATAGFDMNAGADSFSLSLAANGAISADPEALAALEAMAANAESMDPEALDEMMTQGMQAAGALIGSLSGDLNLEVTADGQSIPLHLLLVDGVAYLDLSSLMPSGSGSEGVPQWMGVDLGALLANLGDIPGMSMGDVMGQMGDMSAIMGSDFFQQMSDPAFVAQFLSITRLDDAEVGGQAVAVFETTFDLGAMFASDAFASYMQAVMQMQIESMGAEAAAAMEGVDPEMLGQAMAAMFQDASISMQESIGLADSYVYSSTFDMALTMDMAAMAAAFPAGAGDMTDVPDTITINVNFAVALSNFNAPVEVTAPEGAQMFDPMMFLGAGMPSGA